MRQISKLRFVALIAVLGATGVHAQTSRPTPGPAKPYVLPPYVVDTLPNGLRYAVLENHEVPMVTVRILVPGMGPYGVSFIDPAGKEGAWGMLVSTLREGTTSRTEAQIRDAVEDLGIESLDPTAPLFAAFAFNSARSSWVGAITLYTDMLANPLLPADAFKRVQDIYATMTFGRPTSLRQAQAAAVRAIFGTAHPYTRFPTGESIRAITPDDLREMQSKYLRPQNFTIVVAGDVTAAEVRATLLKATAGWQRGGEKIPAAPIQWPAHRQPTSIYLVDAPGSGQAVIFSMQAVPSRDTPQGPAIALANSVLGEPGNLLGRVGTAFRGERNLSYSPLNAITWRPSGEPALFTATVTVAPANADTAVVTWLQMLRALRSTKPVTEAEFAAARAAAIGRIPRDMERIDNIVMAGMANILRDRLPPLFYNDWVKRLSALTLSDVQSAINTYFDPDHTAIVVIADRSRVESALRATGIPVIR